MGNMRGGSERDYIEMKIPLKGGILKFARDIIHVEVRSQRSEHTRGN